MATLFHAPRACSLAVRIAAAEGGVPLNLRIVDLAAKSIRNGGSFLEINPLGQVSVLDLPNGERLTETGACLLWVQSQSKVASFRRAPDDPAYFQLIKWINFCATELHKQIYRIVFYDEATDPVKARIRALAPARFAVLDAHLDGRSFLLGDTYSAADAYLTWTLVLADKAGIDPTAYVNLEAYRKRVLARPHVSHLVTDDQRLASLT